MRESLDIAFFGSSVVSSCWNGAATSCRGIVHALHQRGHRITFYAPDASARQAHCDIDDPEWAKVVVHAGQGKDGVYRALEQARGADVVVKTSGEGVFDPLLEREVLGLQAPETAVVFWDVDAPATLERITENRLDPLCALIPEYDTVLTCGGGSQVVNAYRKFGARDCVAVHNALDPATHHPVPYEPRFAADLGFLGNRLPDREARVDRFFFDASRRAPQRTFLLGGNDWDQPLPANVRRLGGVPKREHNAFNCSVRMALNVNHAGMARFGWSPPTTVFEAAGVGACLIVDAGEGIEEFLEPGSEVLVAEDGATVAEYLQSIDPYRALRIGQRARQRLLADHTYARRALQVERLLLGRDVAATA